MAGSSGAAATSGAARGRAVATAAPTAIGGEPLRDRDMLAWCTELIDAVFGEPAQGIARDQGQDSWA